MSRADAYPCDYDMEIEIPTQRMTKAVPLGNIAQQAVNIALEEARILEGQNAVITLRSRGEWMAELGPGGWVNTVRPMRKVTA